MAVREALLVFVHGTAGADDYEELSASYTLSNGIRVQILNADIGADWAVFDLTANQAETLGEALIRWAKARAALYGDTAEKSP